VIRPVILALVGLVAGAGLAFGFQALRPPPVDPTPPPAADNAELADLSSCDQVKVLEAQMTDMQVELTDMKADLVEIEGRAADSIGLPVAWPDGQDAASVAAATEPALTASLEKFGGTLLVLDCSESPCIHASIFMGPDADGQGFVDQAPAQGHVRLTTLSGNNAENVPHQVVVRTIEGPAETGGEAAKRIEYRMQQIFPQAVAKITFEPIDPSNPELGWKIAEDEEADADEPGEAGEPSAGDE